MLLNSHLFACQVGSKYFSHNLTRQIVSGLNRVSVCACVFTCTFVCLYMEEESLALLPRRRILLSSLSFCNFKCLSKKDCLLNKLLPVQMLSSEEEVL